MTRESTDHKLGVAFLHSILDSCMACLANTATVPKLSKRCQPKLTVFTVRERGESRCNATLC